MKSAALSLSSVEDIATATKYNRVGRNRQKSTSQFKLKKLL